jgi:hypothetical protein
MRQRLVCFVLIVLAGGWQCAAAATFSFSSIPSSGVVTLSGTAPVGWGYTLENTTESWILPVSLSSTGAAFGTLADLFTYPVIAPGQILSQDYVFNEPGGFGNSLGLFEYVPPPDLPPGTVQIGSFSLLYQAYGDNPDANPEAPPIGGIESVSVPFEIHPGAEQVPEPNTAALLVLGTALLAAIKNMIRTAR